MSVATSVVETPAIGTVQVFRKKPSRVRGIQFTGKNGKDVVAFIRETESVHDVRNGGRYIKITFVDPENPELYGVGEYIMRKNDVVIEEIDGYLTVWPEAQFRNNHTIGKDNAVANSNVDA